MSEWRTARLEEVAQVLGGGTPSRQVTRYFGGHIAWATPTDVTALDRLHLVSTKETVTQEGLNSSSAKLMQPGAVLLTSRATIGYTAVAAVPVCTNQGFVNFVCSENLVPEFLAYWLRTQKEKMLQHAGGTTFKEIARGTLRKFEISFPSVDEQRRIVDLLSRAEGIVRLRRQAQQKAAALIPAIFVDMFGDPATNPNGYKVASLGAIAKIIGGSSLPAGERFSGQQDGLMLLKVSDMNLPGNEVFIRTCNEWIPEQQRTYSHVRAESIVIPKRGAAIATNKKRLTTRPALLDPNLMGLEPDVSFIRSSFLFEWFRLFDLASITSGTTVPQLNKGDLSPLSVYLPPMSQQQAFEDHLLSILEIIALQETAVRKAEAAFNALLARAFAAAGQPVQPESERALA